MLEKVMEKVIELKKIADELGVSITVSVYTDGTVSTTIQSPDGTTETRTKKIPKV